MVRRRSRGDDGRMSETRQESPPDDGFDPHRLRTITDMRRSRDDRIVAGVCSGAARYLNIDPIVVRVVIAVLTFVGLAGLIIYLAAWLLLPADDAEQSVAADWFNLDKHEEQVRVGGLVGAVVLAALAVIGDSSWAWWGVGWVVIPLVILYWLFVVRPRQRDAGTETIAESTAVLPAADDATVASPRPREPRGSSALTGLTLSVAAIAVAITVLVDQANDGVGWTAYIAVALGVVAAGLLLGSFVGRPGPLVPIGLVLTAALAFGSMLPSAATGQRIVTPASAGDVVGVYGHGMGELEVNLADVRDPEQLLGSTVRIEHGMGELRVIVPDDLNVAVDAAVRAGEIRVFERKANGLGIDLDYAAEDAAAPALTLQIRHGLGDVEVIRR